MYATFECTVSIVDEPLRDKISTEVYQRRKAEVGDGTANLDGDDSDDEDLIGYDSIEPGLPPASSDRQKWWLDNGKMARSAVTPPKPMSSSQQTILNPKRPSNPFSPTEEPDWVSVPRSESRLSSFSSMSTSPYEHINHSSILSTSASTPAPRKLPPPSDVTSLTAKAGRLSLGMDAELGKADTPPPPPPRRQTAATGPTASRSQTMPIKMPPKPAVKAASKQHSPPRRPASAASQHSSKSKHAPPVARKPAHLTAATPTSSSPKTSSSETRLTVDEADETRKPPLPRRSSTGIQAFPPRYVGSSDFGGDRGPPHRTISSSPALDEEMVPPPKPARPPGGNVMTPVTTSPGAGVGLVGLTEKRDGPKPLLARKPVVAAKPNMLASNSSRAPDLLGDDSNNMELSGWEALKPS